MTLPKVETDDNYNSKLSNFLNRLLTSNTVTLTSNISKEHEVGEHFQHEDQNITTGTKAG